MKAAGQGDPELIERDRPRCLVDYSQPQHIASEPSKTLDDTLSKPRHNLVPVGLVWFDRAPPCERAHYRPTPSALDLGTSGA